VGRPAQSTPAKLVDAGHRPIGDQILKAVDPTIRMMLTMVRVTHCTEKDGIVD
jgi:hypothetical protein